MGHYFLDRQYVYFYLEFLETELSEKLIASYRDDIDFQVNSLIIIMTNKIYKHKVYLLTDCYKNI